MDFLSALGLGGGGGGGGGGLFGGYGAPAAGGGAPYEQTFRCFPVSFIDKADLEGGDKIILPQSVLDALSRMAVDWPMLFRISNPEQGRSMHCGVMEFSAREGHAYLPYWLMRQLVIEEGGFVTVRNVTLPKSTYIKLQPQSLDFLELSDPKALLERQLRQFSCMTKDTEICFPYNDKLYYVKVVDAKPADAVCIIECDTEVDFAPPPGYKEPVVAPAPSAPSAAPAGGSSSAAAAASAAAAVASPVFSSSPAAAGSSGGGTPAVAFAMPPPAFAGAGHRLDGKAPSASAAASSTSPPVASPSSALRGGGHRLGGGAGGSVGYRLSDGAPVESAGHILGGGGRVLGGGSRLGGGGGGGSVGLPPPGSPSRRLGGRPLTPRKDFGERPSSASRTRRERSVGKFEKAKRDAAFSSGGHKLR